MPLIKILFNFVLIILFGCSNDTSLFENEISKPAVFVMFDQEEYQFSVTKINTISELTITLDTNGGVPAEQITVNIPSPFRFKGGTYPGTGGTCLDNITSSCELVIEFVPTAFGNYQEEMEFTYWTGKAFETKTRTLIGDTNAGITLSDPTHNFGQKVLTTVTTKTYIVTHIGGTTASVLTPQIDSPFSISATTCSTTIANGQTCTLTVSFIPTVVTTSNDDLILSYYDNFETVSLESDVSGQGIPPAVLSISNDSTHDFGLKANTSTTTLVYTVSYASGAVPATAITRSSTPTAPYSMTSAVCNGGSINSGQTCTYTVTFAPTVTGIHNGSFTLSYHDGATTQTITKSFTGESKKQAILSISPVSPQSFGTLNSGQTSDLTFTITNDVTSFFSATSLAASGLSAPITYAGGTFPGTGGTCTTTLAPGSCTIVLRFSPVAAGVFSRTMVFTFNNGASNQTFSMVLNGRSEARINSSVNPVVFTNTTENANRDLSLTLTNAGGATATSLSASALTLPFRFKGGSYPGTGGTCGTTLNSLATCVVVLNFAPTSTATSTDTFSLSYFDGFNNQTLNVPLSGTGITSGVLDLGSDEDLGQKINGSTTDVVVSVTKSGQSSATTVVFTLSGSRFSYKGGTFPGTGGNCGATITVSCSVVLSFNPIATQSYSGTLSVTYNDGRVSTSDAKIITATSISPASISFLPSSYDFGTQTIGSATETIITMSNSGEATATAIVPVITAPFEFKDGNYPGTGGDCDSDLNSLESCSVVIVYEPTTVDGDALNASFPYHNGLNSVSTNLPLSGLGEVVMGSLMQLNVMEENFIQEEEKIKKISREKKWNEIIFKEKIISSQFDEIKIKKLREKEISIPAEKEVEMEGLKLLKFSDWDEDGENDFLATRLRNGQNEVRILSGQTGLELDLRALPKHSHPLSLHRVGDFNKDGIDDYFIGLYKRVGIHKKLSGLKCMDGFSGVEIFQVMK
jgi:hypothetical protein